MSLSGTLYAKAKIILHISTLKLLGTYCVPIVEIVSIYLIVDLVFD